MKTKPANIDVELSDSDLKSVADQESERSGLAAEKDRYLRLAADFDNFRKRTARDSEQRANAQKESFIRELLPIVDNFERALATDATSSDGQVRRGLELISRQLIELLKRHDVEPEDPIGRNFDPQRHEAIGARFDPTRPDHTVIEVIQRGYRRGDDVLRPAQVIINDHTLSPSHHRHGR